MNVGTNKPVFGKATTSCRGFSPIADQHNSCPQRFFTTYGRLVHYNSNPWRHSGEAKTVEVMSRQAFLFTSFRCVLAASPDTGLQDA